MPNGLHSAKPAPIRMEAMRQRAVGPVEFFAFSITTVESETRNANLLDDEIVCGTGASNWCRDRGGAVVIRLS
jgi:hypothetical protein